MNIPATTKVLLLATGALLASCARDLTELKPFPCGTDGTCPTGWYCVPDRGCMELADLPDLEPYPCSTDQNGVESCAAGYFCVTDHGCTRDLEGKIPFACPASGVCPAGLACVSGQCVHAIPDAPCTESVDCAAAGDGFACRLGLCAPSCRGGCVASRICSVPASSSSANEGTCLIDCTASAAACPAWLKCQPLWYSGRKGCLPPDTSMNACVSVTTSESCTPTPFECPNFVVTCALGTSTWTCPAHAYCNGLNNCACGAGYTMLLCSGEPCPDGSCPADDVWGCRANPKQLGCRDATSGYGGTCTCVDGRTLSFACTNSFGSCEAACQPGPAG